MLKKTSIFPFLAAFLLISLGTLPGCSSQKKITKTTEVVTETPEYRNQEGEFVPTKKTITETTEEEDKDVGIIGATFGLIGEIILFPFRLVGSALDLIF